MKCENGFIQSMLQRASEINSPNDDLARNAYLIIREYLTAPFIDLDSRDVKKLLKRVKKIGGLYAQKIIKITEHQLTDKFVDEKIKYAVKQVHIDEKEFHEAREFYRKVKPIFFSYFKFLETGKLDYIVDICSGNGLNGFYWLLQEATEKVVFVDIVENSYFRELEQVLQPDKNRYEYYGAGIDNYTPPNGNTAITAIHSCRCLTDKVIRLASEHKKPFAVMPCCYEFGHTDLVDKSILEYFSAKDECIDIIRIMKIQQAGWKPIVRTIPKQVTDKNRIIIGLR